MAAQNIPSLFFVYKPLIFDLFSVMGVVCFILPVIVVPELFPEVPDTIVYSNGHQVTLKPDLTHYTHREQIPGLCALCGCKRATLILLALSHIQGRITAHILYWDTGSTPSAFCWFFTPQWRSLTFIVLCTQSCVHMARSTMIITTTIDERWGGCWL